MELLQAIVKAAVTGEKWLPKIKRSSKYRHYVSVEDPRRCLDCMVNHGKIYLFSEIPNPNPPLHPYCRCEIKDMQAIKAGTATIQGANGADLTLKRDGVLPECYISLQKLKDLGWKRGEYISDYQKDALLFQGVYHNKDGHLPQAENRVWYEADVNYKGGRRNAQRIVWSNDGLIL